MLPIGREIESAGVSAYVRVTYCSPSSSIGCPGSAEDLERRLQQVRTTPWVKDAVTRAVAVGGFRGAVVATSRIEVKSSVWPKRDGVRGTGVVLGPRGRSDTDFSRATWNDTEFVRSTAATQFAEAAGIVDGLRLERAGGLARAPGDAAPAR